MASPTRPTPSRAASIEQLLAAKEIAVTCGSGGVGKTTVAAALGTMATLELGGRVLVLTVDPARRLATALGLEAFGNVEKPVPPEAFAAAGLKPEGELWVAMLDTRQSWDDLVRRHAPDAKTCDAILANSIYQNVAGRFVQSHDYIAMERLYELHASGALRPHRRGHATHPQRPRLPRRAAAHGRLLLQPAAAVAHRRLPQPHHDDGLQALLHGGRPHPGLQVPGGHRRVLLVDADDGEGFVEPAREVARILGDRRTTFCVVTTLEAAPVHEAEFFVAALEERHLHLGAVVVNKVLPASLLDPGATRAATALQGDSRQLGVELAPLAGADPLQVSRVLVEVAESFRNFQVVAKREAEQRTELGAGSDVTVTVPYFDDDITDLAGLARLGATLWAPAG